MTSSILYAQNSTLCVPIDPRWAPRERTIDMHHLQLEVEFEPAIGRVIGKSTITFSPLYRSNDSIWIDAIRFSINSLTLNGQKVRYTSSDSGIAIMPQKLYRDKANILEINYSAFPEKGIYFTGWDDPTGKGRKQIWTQGQGIDHRHWIPYYDEQHDKLTTEVIVLFEKQFRVISNGKLIRVDTLGAKIRWHYLQDRPHSGYLVMLAIGDYLPYKTMLKQENGEIEFEEFTYPDVPNSAASTFRYSHLFMNNFQKLLKVHYPWPGPYRQVPVVDFIYGAMENTGAVIFGENLISEPATEDYRNYHFVNAHEMAHQWFGNLITAWSARHHWLHESFATYFDLLSTQWTEGDFAFSSKVRQAIMRVKFQEEQNNLPLAHSEAGTARHYQKGGVVLHMLRQLVGDEAFYESLRVFLERHRFRNVHSEDLLYAFHEVTGRDLQWFWNQWIYGSGMPKISLNWKEESDKKSKRLVLHFSQENIYKPDSAKTFRLFFDIEIKTTKRQYKIPVEIRSKRDTLFIPLKVDESVLMVNPDPGKIQLIEWTEIFDPNQNIVRHAEQPYDRFFTYTLNVKNFSNSDLDYIKNEENPIVLEHWINAFSRNVMRPEVWNFFRKFQNDRVKVAALRYTDVAFWKGRTEDELLDFAKTENQLLKVLVYARLINIKPEKINIYKETIDVPKTFTTQNERLQIAIAEANMLKNQTSYEAVAEFAETTYMGFVRAQAINYLGRVNYRSEKLVKLCVHALGHYDRNLAQSASQYLKNITEKSERKWIEEELKNFKKFWPEWKVKKAEKLLE
ncbi:M1 family metallopeptidase [Thermaurantimonas sp.]|uniref:M1 family metallopeptidase n=1 Tax=Thermaurantimonas sp. TaxID=2681568 RepID=UPI00391DED1C